MLGLMLVVCCFVLYEYYLCAILKVFAVAKVRRELESIFVCDHINWLYDTAGKTLLFSLFL